MNGQSEWSVLLWNFIKIISNKKSMKEVTTDQARSWRPTKNQQNHQTSPLVSLLHFPYASIVGLYILDLNLITLQVDHNWSIWTLTNQMVLSQSCDKHCKYSQKSTALSTFSVSLQLACGSCEVLEKKKENILLKRGQ